MTRHSEAAVIRRLEDEYSPATKKFELDDWVAQQLYDTYHNLHNDKTTLFKFKEAVLIYVPTSELINVTRFIDKDVTEHCILLSEFLYKNYGVKKLGNKADIEMTLMLSGLDFKIIAVQISKDLITWYDSMTLVKDVSTSSST
jgi:hypothetical protein